MAFLYRGICESLDSEHAGKLRPKGHRSRVTMKVGDPGLKVDGTFVAGPSEINAVKAHQLENGRHGGCFLSFTRDRVIARNFATTGNMESGYIYVVDDQRFRAYGVVSHNPQYPENEHEKEVSVRDSDCGDLPDEVIVGKEYVEPEIA